MLIMAGAFFMTASRAAFRLSAGDVRTFVLMLPVAKTYPLGIVGGPFFAISGERSTSLFHGRGFFLDGGADGLSMVLAVDLPEKSVARHRLG